MWLRACDYFSQKRFFILVGSAKNMVLTSGQEFALFSLWVVERECASEYTLRSTSKFSRTQIYNSQNFSMRWDPSHLLQKASIFMFCSCLFTLFWRGNFVNCFEPFFSSPQEKCGFLFLEPFSSKTKISNLGPFFFFCKVDRNKVFSWNNWTVSSDVECLVSLLTDEYSCWHS